MWCPVTCKQIQDIKIRRSGNTRFKVDRFPFVLRTCYQRFVSLLLFDTHMQSPARQVSHSFLICETENILTDLLVFRFYRPEFPISKTLWSSFYYFFYYPVPMVIVLFFSSRIKHLQCLYQLQNPLYSVFVVCFLLFSLFVSNSLLSLAVSLHPSFLSISSYM